MPQLDACVISGASTIPLDPVGIALHLYPALGYQAVKIGTTLACGQRQYDAVAHADWSAEQALEDIDAAMRLVQLILQLAEQLLLCVDQIIDARMQTHEALVMRW